jgi:tetratricopeptide (TPR) repeat protein
MKYLIFSALVAFASVTACVHGEAPPAAGEADDPRDGDYHVLMAEIALQRQQFDVAATEYHRALAGNDDPELAARAGRVIYEYGTYDQALDGARHWVDVVPDALEPRRYLVLLYLQQGAVRKSIAHLEFLHDVVEEKSDQGYAALLPILTEARNPEAALEAMGRLAESHDDDPTAAYALAYMGLRSGDVELALTESARALATRPDWPEATVLRARAINRSSVTMRVSDWNMRSCCWPPNGPRRLASSWSCCLASTSDSRVRCAPWAFSSSRPATWSLPAGTL